MMESIRHCTGLTGGHVEPATLSK